MTDDSELPDPNLFKGKCRVCGVAVVEESGRPIARNAECFFLVEIMPDNLMRGGVIRLCGEHFAQALAAVGLDLDALVEQMMAARMN